jgi:hypothetical protein
MCTSPQDKGTRTTFDSKEAATVELNRGGLDFNPTRSKPTFLQRSYDLRQHVKRKTERGGHHDLIGIHGLR